MIRYDTTRHDTTTAEKEYESNSKNGSEGIWTDTVEDVNIDCILLYGKIQ